MRIRFGIELILYFTSILPIIIIFYYSLRSCRKPVKNTYFGIKIPAEFIDSEEVKAISERFVKKNKLYHIIALIGSLPLLLEFIYVSIYILVLMIYIFAIIAFLYIPYVQANRELKALKKERGWIVASNKITEVDTKSYALEDLKFKKLKDPILISILPYLFVLTSRPQIWMTDVFLHSLFITAIITVSCIVLPYFLFVRYIFSYDYVYSEDSDVNINLNIIRRNNWRFLLNSLLIFCTSINIFTTFFLLDSITYFWFYASLIVNTTFLMIATIAYMYKSSKLNKLKEDFSLIEDFGGNSVDDDSNWILGLWYYNPDDKKVFVEPVYTSFAGSYTFNMATKVGKIGMGITGVLVVSMFILFVALVFDEIIPHRIDTSNANEIRISSTLYNTNFLVSDIISVEMAFEIPPAVRVNGLATSQVLRGRFNTSGGRVNMFINRNHEDFIIIETPQYVVFVNGASPEETWNIYDEIYTLWRR